MNKESETVELQAASVAAAARWATKRGVSLDAAVATLLLVGLAVHKEFGDVCLGTHSPAMMELAAKKSTT